MNKIYYNEDDRAQRLIDIFDFLPGQVNVSYVNSTKHIVAWHKHNIQTDYWTCLKGSFKAGMATEEEGCKLMYYVTEKYNPEDEIRAEVGHFGEDWGVLNK